MQTYILELACETCGIQMRNRVGDLSAGPGDEPTIDIDMSISQSTFECHNCGGVTYLGDIDLICEHEPGDLTDDDEADDEAAR